MFSIHRHLASATLLFAAGSMPAHAQQVFERSAQAWAAAVGTLPISTITFDTIPGSTTTAIVGDEFRALPAGPIFTSIVGDGVYVGNPAPDQIPFPPSSPNMLSPSSCARSCEGIIRLTFDTPVLALGATFIDVEDEFALTGYSLVLGAAAPSIAFTSAPGDRSFEFLGFVADVPFSAVDIYFTTGPGIDGSLLDNLVYARANDGMPAPVPEPTTAALVGLGLVLMGIRARRRA